MPSANPTRSSALISPDRPAEFEVARRRPFAQRWRYAFIKTYKPVTDDVKHRPCETTQQYRDWCQKEDPSWLGYGRVG